jgi:hypothetical protein
MWWPGTESGADTVLITRKLLILQTDKKDKNGHKADSIVRLLYGEKLRIFSGLISADSTDVFFACLPH